MRKLEGELGATLFDRLIVDTNGLALVPIPGRAPEFLTAIAAPSNRRLTGAARALLGTIKTHVSG